MTRGESRTTPQKGQLLEGERRNSLGAGTEDRIGRWREVVVKAGPECSSRLVDLPRGLRLPRPTVLAPDSLQRPPLPSLSNPNNYSSIYLTL